MIYIALMKNSQNFLVLSTEKTQKKTSNPTGVNTPRAPNCGLQISFPTKRKGDFWTNSRFGAKNRMILEPILPKAKMLLKTTVISKGFKSQPERTPTGQRLNKKSNICHGLKTLSYVFNFTSPSIFAGSQKTKPLFWKLLNKERAKGSIYSVFLYHKITEHLTRKSVFFKEF